MNKEKILRKSEDFSKIISNQIGFKNKYFSIYYKENLSLYDESGELLQFARDLIEQMATTINCPSNWRNIGEKLADEYNKAVKIAGGVRIKLGNELDLLEKDVYKFCWIVDFPMYELSDEGTIDFNHNPFSMPQGGMDDLENNFISEYEIAA